MTKKKKIIIGVVLVAAVGIAVAVKALGGSSEGAVMPVSAADVEKKDIEELLTIKAPLEGTESIEVVSKLHYKILSINVKEGDMVTEGQVIAQLDKETLEDEIAKLEANVQLLQIQYSESSRNHSSDVNSAEKKLEDTLEQSQRDYEAALDALKTAQRDYDSKNQLFEAGAESETAVEDAKVALDDAQRKVDGFNEENGKVVATPAQLADISTSVNNSSLSSSAKQIEIAKRDLEIKKKELEDCYIKSSISGTVTRVNAKVGRFADEIGDNTPMFIIEDLKTLEMKGSVSEYSIGKIALGQPVKIYADIISDDYAEGKVTRISPTGEEKSGTNERFIPIQIDITGDTKGLIAGINATSKIQVAKSENTLVVPIEALMDNNDGTYAVMKINEDNTIKKISVELGVESDLEIEIKSPEINEGDKVVLSPTEDLTDGMSVILNE